MVSRVRVSAWAHGQWTHRCVPVSSVSLFDMGFYCTLKNNYRKKGGGDGECAWAGRGRGVKN